MYMYSDDGSNEAFMKKASEPDFFGGIHVSRSRQPNNDRWPRKAPPHSHPLTAIKQHIFC